MDKEMLKAMGINEEQDTDNEDIDNEVIEKSGLRKGEKVTCEATIGSIASIGYVILTVIAIIVAFSIPNPIILILCGIVCLFGIYQMLQIKNIELYYTNKRVVGKTGILNVKSLDTPLNKVNNVSVQSNILGYGTVTISSSSGNYHFKYITNAEEIRNGLMEEIEKYEQEKIKEQAIQMAKAMRGEEIKQ